MTKWEYHVAPLRPEDRPQHEQQAYLQDLGAHGWELVAVIGNWAYLKRSVQAKACAGCGLLSCTT